MKKLLILFVLFLIFLHSCKIDNNYTITPQIPPANYYKLNINNFEKLIDVNILDTNYINWYNSKLIYQSWKNNLCNFSITLKALYLLSFQNANTFDDYTEYREVNFDTNNVSYKFLLYSTKNLNNEIEWEMYQYINNSSKYLIALKGKNSENLENGKWTFYETQNSNIPSIVIYWKQTDSIFQQIFSQIDSSNSETSYLKLTENFFENDYKIKLENYNFYLKNGQLIELYKDKNHGRIKDSIYYKDKNWHYWSFEVK